MAAACEAEEAWTAGVAVWAAEITLLHGVVMMATAVAMEAAWGEAMEAEMKITEDPVVVAATAVETLAGVDPKVAEMVATPLPGIRRRWWPRRLWRRKLLGW